MEEVKVEILESWINSFPQKYAIYVKSKVNLENYFMSVHEYYKCREKTFNSFHFQSPELQFRSELVRWLKALKNEINFSTLTLHLGIHLMDFFMDNHSIPIDKLSKVAMVCLILASNFEDLDGSFPNLQSICLKVGQEYNRKTMIKIYNTILKYYDFNVGRPTVAHFVQIYSTFLIDLTDLERIGANSSNLIEYFDQGHHHINKLLDDYLNESQYLKFEMSLVASFFVFVARKMLRLESSWTKMLKFITGYCLEDFQPLIQLFNSFEQNENICESEEDISADDSGYTTSSSCSSPNSNYSTSTIYSAE